MAAESGGIASKLGSTYERQFAIDRLLDLVAGQVIRLRWEPNSETAGGADIEVEHITGVVEHIQLKRQNRADARWTVANLRRVEVLDAAASWLDGDEQRQFTFVSSDPVRHLKDICDQLRRSADSARDFVEKRIGKWQHRHRWHARRRHCG